MKFTEEKREQAFIEFLEQENIPHIHPGAAICLCCLNPD
jgi:hypothetical protein